MFTPGVFVETEGRAPRRERRDFHGVPIIIEFRKGDIKPGHDPEDGFGFEQLADYGFIPGTTTNEEGEGLDVYIGPDPESERVFVVALMNPHDLDTFMEYKVLLGWDSHHAAMHFCKAQYFDDMIGLLYEMTIPDLIDWTDLQAPMAEKLIIRIQEEEEAAEIKQKEKAIHEPELTIVDEEGGADRPTENQPGESTYFDNQHRHVLLPDGTMSETKDPDGPLHTHTWTPDGLKSSTDAGHFHFLPRAIETKITVS